MDWVFTYSRKRWVPESNRKDDARVPRSWQTQTCSMRRYYYLQKPDSRLLYARYRCLIAGHTTCEIPFLESWCGIEKPIFGPPKRQILDFSMPCGGD